MAATASNCLKYKFHFLISPGLIPNSSLKHLEKAKHYKSTTEGATFFNFYTGIIYVYDDLKGSLT
jgi:hypothetical protein